MSRKKRDRQRREKKQARLAAAELNRLKALEAAGIITPGAYQQISKEFAKL